MSAASQGAFVVSLGISLGDISYMIIKENTIPHGNLVFSFSRFAFAAGAVQAVSKLCFLYLWKIFVFFRER